MRWARKEWSPSPPHHTVHKLNDCLHPMECIPETQFLMRSKINLGLLLHMWHVYESEEDYSQFEQILLYACFIEEPGSNPAGGKNLRQSWNISKATPLGRDLTIFGTTIWCSTTVPRCTVLGTFWYGLLRTQYTNEGRHRTGHIQ